MGRILAAAAFALALGCARADDSAVRTLLDEHNRQRTQRGLDPLVADESLCEYAQAHSEKMADRGLLVHSSMSKLAVRSGNGNVGENIAWGQNSEEEVCDSWMRSPGHKSNILGKRFKRAGFGVNYPRLKPWACHSKFRARLLSSQGFQPWHTESENRLDGRL